MKTFHSTIVGVAALLISSVACGPTGLTTPSAAKSSRSRPVNPRIVNVPGTPILLTAQQMTTTLPNGTAAPMWGYCPTGTCTTTWAPGPTIVATAGTPLQITLTNNLPVATSLVVLGQLGGGLGTPATMASPTHAGQNFSTFAGNADLRPHNCSSALSTPCTSDAQCTALLPAGQTCVVASTCSVTNTQACSTAIPCTAPQTCVPAGPVFNPPAQVARVKSFGAEAPAATVTTTGTVGGTQTLKWANLKAGTYLYETGTLPSLQVPMGLYGVLVVTTAPTTTTSSSGTCSGLPTNICTTSTTCPAPQTCTITSTTSFTSGIAYPGVNYDADAALLFSEIDTVQNAAVDAAAVGGQDVNMRFNDPACTAAKPCYPAAVNYAPTYFLINGKWFDKTAPQNSAFTVGDAAASNSTYSSGNILVRLLNAGSHTHVPSIVGLPMSLVAEDGNAAPPVSGKYKVQNEVLLTAGKTHDVLLKPAAAAGGASYAPATLPVFDRALSLSTGTHRDGGMQAFLLVNHASAQATGTCSGTTTTCSASLACVTGTCGFVPVAGAPGNLPGNIIPTANPDTFAVPYNPIGCGVGTAPACTSISGNVTANDIGIVKVALGTTVPLHGVLTLNPDGSFTFTATAGYTGLDQFTYVGNGVATLTAIVTLNVDPSGIGAAPTANADTYTSSFTIKFSAQRPGVLANDTDPNGYPLIAGSVTGSTCTSVTLNPDGSFSVTGTGASCLFSYTATNSQGTTSAPAQVTVNFGMVGGKAGLPVTAVDATTGVAITDYRWTLQEDLTFKHGVGQTPPLNARTVGTSFHRSHMPVVAAGCVGAVSCGSGQSVRSVAVTDAQALLLQTTPDQVVLDPSKHYFISILPGDGANPVITPGPTPPQQPGHTMAGTEVKLLATGAWAPVTLKFQANPLPTAQMSVYLHEDDNPTNGADEPGEAGLGGFEVVLVDPAGRTGDVAGQNTYDSFNMPLSNSLLGRTGCPDTLNAATNGTKTSATGNFVGVVYTCPNPSPEEVAAVAAIANPAARAAARTALNAKYTLAGHALVKNVTPARYDVFAHPSAAREGAGEVWWQTETLEGTPAQDAFVGYNEPGYFQEFGPPGPHVVIGFVNPDHVKAYAHANKLDLGTNTITGKVTSQHMTHPHDVTLYDSTSYDLLSATNCRVVLNSQGGLGRAVAAAQCNPDGTFKLTNIPVGVYGLAIFDQWLDQIIQTAAVTVPAPVVGTTSTTVALGDIPVLGWFTQFDQHICLDTNNNGKCDPGEGISNVRLTVRFRNGAPSNRPITDSTGSAPVLELFPLFNWYVAEADTTRFKQSGVHIIVDGGGKPDATGAGAGLWSSQYADGSGSTERLETPGSLTYGTQGFISQRSTIEWLRTPYAAGENGGITGTVVLSATRPFDDQRFNVQNIWAPLVPRVTMNLYQKITLADGTQTLKLVDTTATSSWDDYANLVFGHDTSPYLLGTDGTLRDPITGVLALPAAYPPGKQVNMYCPGQNSNDPFVNYTLELTGTAGANPDTNRCYDGWHNWNQVQAAPYDGRYTFPSAAYALANPLCVPNQISTPANPCTTPVAGQTLVSLPLGTYVVEAVTPPGYEIVKEQDKSILIGDAFIAPVTQQFGGLVNIFILPDQATIGNANPDNPNTGDPGFQSDPTTNLGAYNLSNGKSFPECVGDMHRVPDFLSLYPQAAQVSPFAGMDRPLCDRKLVVINDQAQSSASFFIFTYAPVAANNTGIILDDASSEFNAVAPDFGEKASVPFVPVSIKDFAGLEINRTYSDQWGAYNMMTPSSWLVNPPTPSGYGPGMLITCINDPGPIPDPTDPTGKRLITDPQYNPSYSNFCYTNPYMPGQTTYLDTPVLPIAAFAAGYNPPDCAQPDNAPVVKRVDSSAGFGPWLPSTGGTLTITAQGDQQVPNPAYNGPFSTDPIAGLRTITRHYGFGAKTGLARLMIGGTNLTASTAWADGVLTVTVPGTMAPGAHELSIRTGAGKESFDTVTVTIAAPTDLAPTRVSGASTPPGKIQDAIDAAKPGDLILIDAGTYNELVIMWKPVRLQGVGAGSVIINAAKYPNAKVENWRPRINSLFSVDPVTGLLITPAQVDPLPTQEITGGVIVLEPTVLGSEEGAGITVLAKNLPAGQCANGAMSTSGHPITESNFHCASSRIDGISVTGGDAGGGIYVNGWAHKLEISNNRVYGNAGAFNGGVRIGLPYLELESLPAGLQNGRIRGFGFDDHVKIHHNSITKNGTVEAPSGNGGAGGGLSICAGTDHYTVEHNYICGNLSSSDGGGIGHIGFSQDGTIAHNEILFNQSFQQTGSTHGGGIAVIGEPPVAGTVSLGTGDLIIDSNLIRGNFAEGGHGGGIRLQQVNGADVAAHKNARFLWHFVLVTNNMIFDNVAGWAGGGISLADTVNAYLVSNTVANNDSAGIAGVVLAGGVKLPGIPPPGQIAGRGYPSPAGLVTEPTSTQLIAQSSLVNAISQPQLLAFNIVYQNRSFFYSGNGRLCSGNNVNTTGICNVLPDQPSTGFCVNGAKYWDLGVLGDATPVPGAIHLNPVFSDLTSTIGYATSFTFNTATNPPLVERYCDGSRVVPELPGVINPRSVYNLQVAATVDEGNNYVNLKYGPLYVERPTSPTTGVTFGDYSTNPGFLYGAH